MIRGLLDLYEVSFEEQWLEWSVQLQAKLDDLFWDKDGVGYFMVTSDDPSILVRMKEGKKKYSLPPSMQGIFQFRPTSLWKFRTFASYFFLNSFTPNDAKSNLALQIFQNCNLGKTEKQAAPQ